MVLNRLYLDKNIVAKAREVYAKEKPKNIRLDQIFQPTIFKLLQEKLFTAAYKLKFNPLRFKYQTAKVKEVDSFLKGYYFKELVLELLNLKKYNLTYEIRLFEPGNYTLLHDAEKELAGIDFILDFSQDAKNASGCIKYLTSDEELVELDPKKNTLSFVERKQNIMRYVKYVNHRQTPRILVMGTLLVE